VPQPRRRPLVPLRPSNARRRHRRRVTLPCWICRSTLTGTKLPPNSMISAQSLTTRRSSVTLIAASSQPLPTKTVTTARSRPRRPNAGLHPLGRWRLLLGPSEGDRFGGDRRGVPSEELCGEASSSGGVRGDPLADRANERAIREDSVATGAVRVSKGCRVSSAVAAVDCDVRRARCRGVRGSVDLEPRRTTDGRGQQAVQEPVDALDSRGIGSDTPTSVGEVRRPRVLPSVPRRTAPTFDQNSNQL